MCHPCRVCTHSFVVCHIASVLPPASLGGPLPGTAALQLPVWNVLLGDGLLGLIQLVAPLPSVGSA